MQWPASLLDCWTWPLNMGQKLCSFLDCSVLTAAHAAGELLSLVQKLVDTKILQTLCCKHCPCLLPITSPTVAPVWGSFYICNICIDDCVQVTFLFSVPYHIKHFKIMFPDKKCPLYFSSTFKCLYTYSTSITPGCRSEAAGIWGANGLLASALEDWQILGFMWKQMKQYNACKLKSNCNLFLKKHLHFLIHQKMVTEMIIAYSSGCHFADAPCETG